METLLQDLRFALRQLRKTSGFTVVVVITLALGIGANTAFFGVLNATLFRPLPYPRPGQLVHIHERMLKSDGEMPVAYPDFVDWKRQQTSFSALAIYRTDASLNLTTSTGTDRVAALLVDHDFLKVLGTQLESGRDFTANDDRLGAPLTALITHAAWANRFNSDSAIVGRTLTVDGKSTTIIGILPQGFQFFSKCELIEPLGPFVEQLFMQMREQHSNAMVVGRLKPGVSLTNATGEMNAIAARLASDYPKSNGGNGVALIPLRRYLMGDAEQGQLLLMGAVGLVLLIVCANVATLSLARSSSRDREMAIRTALGANRPRLVRQLVVESLLLAFIGGGLGLLLATGLGSTLGSLVPFSMQQLNPAGATAVDFRVEAFAFLITLATGLGFGLAPAWQLSRTNPNDALKDRSSINPSAPGRFRTSDAVVVAQVGLATLLVITAGLVLRSLWSLSSTPLGYQPENVLSLHLASPGARVGGSMLRVAAFYTEAADRLARLPGVEAAAATSNLPFGNNDSSSQFRLLDRPAPQPEEYPSSSYRIVSRDYFRAMGIPLQRGRFFSGEEPMPSIPADNPKLPEIIAALRKVPFDGIVTRSFAQRFWPGQEPIGKQFLVGPAGVEMGNVTIVGVVGDTSQDSLSQSGHEEYYLSLRQFPAPFEYSLILRAHGDPSALAAAAKSELRLLTSQEPVYDVLPLSSRIADSFSTQTFETRLLSWFAGIALLLASVGLYGVLAFNVGRRSREFGIRIALGASTKSVLKAVFFRGFALVVPGLAIGVFAAWALGRYVQNELHGISATDPRTYATGVLALLISALLACWIPARRAAAVNPMDALRDE